MSRSSPPQEAINNRDLRILNPLDYSNQRLQAPRKTTKVLQQISSSPGRPALVLQSTTEYYRIPQNTKEDYRILQNITTQKTFPENQKLEKKLARENVWVPIYMFIKTATFSNRSNVTGFGPGLCDY